MLFDFILRPLKEVNPLGQPPNLTLSWFWLTDGFYRLKVGSHYLLNYSDDYVKYCIENFPSFPETSFVDYYIVRLWEDILDILPDVLEPIPEELCRFLEMSETDWDSWRDKAVDWEEAQIKSGQSEDDPFNIFCIAVELRRSRYLPSGHLQNSPRIWVWSTDSTVNISWDNQGIQDAGINVWSALRGNYQMHRDDFLKEIYAFHEKLFFEMGQRVEAICNDRELPEIYIDIEHLNYEQSDRATWLNAALSKTPTFNNWQDVRSAINLITESKA
jgi:Family of unknown function (DUF5984)